MPTKIFIQLCFFCLLVLVGCNDDPDFKQKLLINKINGEQKILNHIEMMHMKGQWLLSEEQFKQTKQRSIEKIASYEKELARFRGR